jgi:hypothetical protein
VTKLLLILAGIAFFALLIGRAYDHELTPAPAQAADARETYQGRTIQWWARRAVQARKDANARGRTIARLRGELATREIGPTLAIRLVFGPYAEQALRVAWCESRWHTGAQNGQYLGLFQMGSFARSTYGHAGDALGQARAAYAYFTASGYDWSPWECKP